MRAAIVPPVLAHLRGRVYAEAMRTESQPSERRAAPRRPVDVYFNKYIDGQPFVCEAIELSTTGMLVRKIHEPDAPRACYAVEIASMTESGE